MIKQGLNNDILEKKFKILRTSIMLGNVQNREELLRTYEDTAKEIDRVRRSIYEEKIASKMYTTTTLEEEEKRLKELVGLIENRINERNSFVDDYIAVTSNYLDDLPSVSEEDKVVDYKMRLDNIEEFLNNCKEIDELNSKLKDLRDKLEEKYENKADNEIINAKLEGELIEEFNKFITSDSYYGGLNYTDIDDELVKIEGSLNEKNDVMSTFISSYEALRNAGISGSEREEYLSYVNDSKMDYYNELEKKYILSIYKLVLDKESDYNKLFEKREKINNILKERLDWRNNLGINVRDDLAYFVGLCNEQFSVIKSQKFNIDDIDNLILAINECETRLSVLEEANNRREIADLIAEYSTESPSALKIDIPAEEDFKNEYLDDNKKVNSFRKPNLVVSVSEPTKINVKTATDTAKLVMKKVVIVLEPKKFNNKRDKIKEAEEELKKEKEKELEEKVDLFENNSDFVDLDVSNETNSHYDDVFLDDTIADNNKEEEESPLYLENLKVNTEENSVDVPTEIFIDNTSEENNNPDDLFSNTDPFLDDNEFENNENKDEEKKGELINGVPVVGNIGTVKPNNVLSKINDVAEENADIILPTNGLVDGKNESVPIVSENYIKES